MAFLQQEAFDRLSEALDAGRLAHAYLLCGPRGSGKNAIVEQIAARILEVPASSALRHPDIHVAEPESRSRRILIEQIRRLEHAVRNKPVAGSRKVAVIREADRLQPQAANAFLKTLEEPPPGTHVFLTSSLPGALLETITSRCIVIHLRAIEKEPPSEADLEVIAALEKAVLGPSSATTSGFQLSSTFLAVLNRERDAIREQFQEAFKQDQAHYRQTTDGAWLEEREDQIKALVEASTLRRRSDLIQAIASWFTDALRIQHGAAPVLDRPALREAAGKMETRLLLRQVRAVEETAGDLSRGVQEALAVEAGFLKVFASLP